MIDASTKKPLHVSADGGLYIMVPVEQLDGIRALLDAHSVAYWVDEIAIALELKQVSCGTEINIVQAGIPDVIPPESCYLGWQESLVLLAQLVEAEIPG
jgi:hypothetical protein